MEYANFKISSVLTKPYYTSDAQQEWDSYHLISRQTQQMGFLLLP